MSWVIPRRVGDLYNCWWSFGRPMCAMLWKMVPTCLFWCLWRERNDRIFEDRKSMLGEILSLSFKTLYLLTEAYVSPLSISYSDFLLVYLGCAFNGVRLYIYIYIYKVIVTSLFVLLFLLRWFSFSIFHLYLVIDFELQ
jgi:hypothetical protein